MALEKKQDKQNCPNCIYCCEMEEIDKDTYKTFCECCGHWLKWRKAYNCNCFISKEEMKKGIQ